MLISRNQSYEKELVKNAVFSLIAGRHQRLNKVTTLLQIGLFPHKKGKLPISIQNRFVM